jgi:hypothetical protein
MGSIATGSDPSAYVRFTPGSDQTADITERQFRANKRHATKQHFVRGRRPNLFKEGRIGL